MAHLYLNFACRHVYYCGAKMWLWGKVSGTVQSATFNLCCNIGKFWLDESLANVTARVYTFTINGAIHHKIGSLLPTDAEAPKFAQIYLCDYETQLY